MKAMQAKTIKRVLRTKFNKFAESITDADVRNLVKRNSVITGGAIASLLTGEPVNDYDVYFTNAETVRAVAQYYTNKFKETHPGVEIDILDGTISEAEFLAQEEYEDYSWYAEEYEDEVTANEWYLANVTPGRIKIRVTSAGVAVESGFEHGDTPEHVENVDDTTEKEAFRPVYISANAITLADDFQLIIRFFGNVEEIHKNYDFSHCTCSWASANGELSLPGKALECLLSKTLHYQGSKYPLASIIRTRKFIARGFTINAGQYLKMCMQLNDLDLRDLAVLEDQLTGVDASYFANMIAVMDGEKMANDVDNSYVIGLIDKFF